MGSDNRNSARFTEQSYSTSSAAQCRPSISCMASSFISTTTHFTDSALLTERRERYKSCVALEAEEALH